MGDDARRGVLFLLLAVLAFAAPGGRALAADGGQEEGTVRVEVVGEAAIIGGDVAAARDQALTDARLRAIERVAGVRVSAKASYIQELLANSALRVTMQGAILHEEVREEGPGDDGLYRVRLVADVSRRRVADALVALRERDLVAVTARVVAPAHSPDPADVRSAAVEGLQELGFRNVFDLDAVPPVDGPAARRLGLAAGADVVLALDGSASVPRRMPGGLWSTTVSGRVMLYRVREERVLLAESLEEVRGFGADPAAAVRDGALAFVRQAVTVAGERLRPHEARVLRVEVLALRDFAAFERMRNLLLALRWVEEVQVDPVGFHPRRTVFLVRTALDPVSLAAAVERVTGAEVIRAGERRVVVRSR